MVCESMRVFKYHIVDKIVHGGSFNAKCTFKAKLRIAG